jgi:hypothetical protein
LWTSIPFLFNRKIKCHLTYYRRYDSLWKDTLPHPGIENHVFHQFESIFLICPTYRWNRTYDQDFIHEDESFFVIPCRQDDVEKYLIKFVVDFTTRKESLIILDDCASTKSVKDRTEELVDLGFSARHMSISTIVITQQLTSIAKPYRQNT